MNMNEKTSDQAAREDDVKWVEAVHNLITLTKGGALKWTPVDPSDVVVYSSRARVLSAYEATYSRQRMRLQEEGYPPPDPREAIFAISGFAPPTKTGGNITETQVSLRLLDTYGGTTFVFPQVDGLGDLLAAAKTQQANIEGFLDDIKQAVA